MYIKVVVAVVVVAIVVAVVVPPVVVVIPGKWFAILSSSTFRSPSPQCPSAFPSPSLSAIFQSCGLKVRVM